LSTRTFRLNPVAACVVFKDGKTIQQKITGTLLPFFKTAGWSLDDFASMEEVSF